VFSGSTLCKVASYSNSGNLVEVCSHWENFSHNRPVILHSSSPCHCSPYQGSNA
jgi:hypothetical protein